MALECQCILCHCTSALTSHLGTGLNQFTIAPKVQHISIWQLITASAAVLNRHRIGRRRPLLTSLLHHYPFGLPSNSGINIFIQHIRLWPITFALTTATSIVSLDTTMLGGLLLRP